jgi:hypothetical protein
VKILNFAVTYRSSRRKPTFPHVFSVKKKHFYRHNKGYATLTQLHGNYGNESFSDGLACESGRVGYIVGESRQRIHSWIRVPQDS